ncbi:phosphotransferase [Ornithinimicrobium flavum]|uniref:phosphotransferase n=1 Tax=Ornithinimicrobium flavum TaxID=1288636 RepID=UPI0013053C6F|nr:aminoglycoside phosphotransferase family protein [Ornithinimicrobium flavum]
MPETSLDPVLDLLLDPAWLSRTVGLPVRITRLRSKPGVSHAAALLPTSPTPSATGRAFVTDIHNPTPTGRAFVTDIHSPDAPIGWVLALVGEARRKRDKRIEAITSHRPEAPLGELDLPDLDAQLLWGPTHTDPRLVGPLAEIDLSVAELLRYNPLRRAVLRLGDHVVRVTAEPHRDRLTRVARALAAHGVPVTTPVPAAEAGLRGGRRTTVWRWVEGADLATRATSEQLRDAGTLLARLHASPTTLGPELGLARRGWAHAHAAAEATVLHLEGVARYLTAPLREALTALPAADTPERSAGLAGGPDVVLHGDFSLDQVLAGDTGLVLTDLDRAAVGPAEVDLASVLAVAIIEGTDLRPLLAAYGASPAPAWVAAALLARAAEPWRAQEPGWEQGTLRRARLALEVLAPWTVPGAVEQDGDRVEVLRAWPDTVVDGVARVAIEGPDQHGRLRAGTVDATGAVRLLPPGTDRRLPALAGPAERGRLVVHRPARRAVVALPDRYLKVLRPGRAPAVAELSRRGRALAGAAGLGAADVLSADDGTVAFSVLPGRPVHELAEERDWPGMWSAWARAWARFQALDAPDLPAHTADDEAQVLLTWRERAERAGVLRGTPWAARLGEVAEELAAAPHTGARLVPTHRDLHDKQLLWDGARLSVLDLDTVCRAEPALDLANLAVHARLRQAQGRWSARATATMLEAVDRVADASDVDPERMRLARRATVARLAAVYAFRPPWRESVLRWAVDEWPLTSEDENSLIVVSPPSPRPAGR